MGFLGVCLVMGGEGVKLYVPLSKTCTQTYAVSENIPFSTTTPLILLMSALFLQKDSIFLVKNSTFTQSNSMRAVRDLLVLFSVFVRQKININDNESFTDHASRIRLPDCSKSVIN